MPNSNWIELTKKFRRLACFHYLDWNPGACKLREFAATMLAGFAILGFVSFWRTGHVGGAVISLWTAGAALAVAAMIPRLGPYAYRAVYIPALLVGHVVSQLILVALYALVFIPLGIALRLFGKDLLRLARPDGSMWTRLDRTPDPSQYYRQF